MRNVNLVPKTRKPKKSLRLSIIIYFSVLIVVLGYLFYTIYLTNLNIALLKADITNNQNEISRLQQYVEFRNDLERMKSQVESIQTEYDKGRLKESQVLSIIESITPIKLSYDSVEILSDGEVILKNCKARTYETVAQFLKNIKYTSFIERIEISAITIGQTLEDQEILAMFPDRDQDYVIVGQITTDDTFEDAFWFDTKFTITSSPE